MKLYPVNRIYTVGKRGSGMEALTTVALTISHASVQSFFGLVVGSLLSFVNVQLWDRKDLFNPTEIDKQLLYNIILGSKADMVGWRDFFEVFLEFVSNLSLTCLAYAYVVTLVVSSGTYSDPAAGLAFMITSIFSNFPLLLDLATMVFFIYEQLATMFKKKAKDMNETAAAQPDSVSQLGIRPTPISALNPRAGNSGFHR